jgi:hypothetical protein
MAYNTSALEGPTVRASTRYTVGLTCPQVKTYSYSRWIGGVDSAAPAS